MIKLTMGTYKEVAEFLRNEKIYMFSLIVNSVREGLEINLPVVHVIEFNIKTKDDKIKVSILKKDFKRNLLMALEFYENAELYEKCIEVNNLILGISDL